MKKKISRRTIPSNGMRAEYDFSGGVRGKHYQAMQNGYTVRVIKADGTVVEKHYGKQGTVTLAPDVRKYFPNSQVVNQTLRSLIALLPKKQAANHR